MNNRHRTDEFNHFHAIASKVPINVEIESNLPLKVNVRVLTERTVTTISVVNISAWVVRCY